VITNLLASKPGRIAIYGWHRSSGDPIQPLSTVHGARYADYSHGIRLVSEMAILNGKLRSIYDILQDRLLAKVLGDEGAIRNLWQITAPSNVPFRQGRAGGSSNSFYRAWVTPVRRIPEVRPTEVRAFQRDLLLLASESD
jgi:hypothetical protein